MPSIQATCPECGDIELMFSDVSLHMNEDTSVIHCVFACPVCGRRTSRLPAQVQLDRLIAAGIEIQPWHLPPEVADPARRVKPDVDVILDELDDFQKFYATDPDDHHFAEQLERFHLVPDG